MSADVRAVEGAFFGPAEKSPGTGLTPGLTGPAADPNRPFGSRAGGHLRGQLSVFQLSLPASNAGCITSPSLH
ncbi:unnamed protein product, partial [Iphiclides podalirius]